MFFPKYTILQKHFLEFQTCEVSFIYWKSKQYCYFLCMWLLMLIFSALLFNIGHMGQLKVHHGFAHVVTTLWKCMANKKQRAKYYRFQSDCSGVTKNLWWKQLSFISHMFRYCGIFKLWYLWSERDKMWSRLAAHICHFFGLTARNPVFHNQ